jgi:hypothetical protein
LTGKGSITLGFSTKVPSSKVSSRRMPASIPIAVPARRCAQVLGTTDIVDDFDQSKTALCYGAEQFGFYMAMKV